VYEEKKSKKNKRNKKNKKKNKKKEKEKEKEKEKKNNNKKDSLPSLKLALPNPLGARLKAVAAMSCFQSLCVPTKYFQSFGACFLKATAISAIIGPRGP